MNSNKFWNMLNESSKLKVEEFLYSYNGSDGIKGRIFEMYEEGAYLSGLTTIEYLEEVNPDDYVEYMYNSYLEREI